MSLATHGQPAPAPVISNDALSCVFAFLDLATLHALLGVNRHWISVVMSTPCVGGEFTGSSAGAEWMDTMCASRLARKHLSELELFGRSTLSSTELGRISGNLVGLRLLRIHAKLVRSAASEAAVGQDLAFRFPPKLRELQIRTQYQTPPLEEFIHVLSALPELYHLEKLCIAGEMPLPSEIDTLKQLSLPRLHTLRITGGALTAAQCSWITCGALPSLTHLIHVSLHPSMTIAGSLGFAPLGRPHADLKLRQLDIQDNYAWSDLLLNSLAGLGHCLRTLLPPNLRCSTLDWVATLPHLESLALRWTHHGPNNGEQIALSLRSSQSLRHLYLSHALLDSAHLSVALQYLPQLESLSLTKLPSVTTLHFLRSAPPTLTALSVQSCYNPQLLLTDLELSHLTQLRSLSTLVMSRCFGEEPAAVLARLKPPSAIMPSLSVFAFNS